MSEPNQQKQLTAVVHGAVQGVSFRYYTHRTANRLGVTGWVANQPDGTVKVVAEGEEAALRQLAAFLQEGPAAATVQQVEEKWSEATGEFQIFSVRYSYG
jgi:acylphosphatase